ncbi:MAG: aldehyde dehydrogenase family protein [Chloroflexi bacterium]|nr:aldehyde dehydrogenase family protein [Chloroflexota bacterium]
MLLNGEWVDRPNTIEVRNPQDNSLIDTVPKATAADMETAITAAEAWFTQGRRLPVYERMAILEKTAVILTNKHEEYARIIAQEGIKTIREARKEVTRCIETIRISAEEARRLNGETITFDQMPGSENRRGFYSREPIGIIGAITPFNDPLNLVAHKVGPALAGGNAIIVKPDSKTPLSALWLAQAIHEAGVPAGMLQVIPGPGREVGDVLVTDPRVRMISFTGGLKTGKAIMSKVGLKKVGMELGSNAPVIVLSDAELDTAVSANISGAFWAAGQNCLHVQRLLVHEEIYDEFAARFIAETEAYKVGDKLDEATDMGPLINETEAKRVERLVNEALEMGANLLTGGERSGTFYAPTVLENLPDSCTLAQEEIYGPVTILYRIATLDEAIARANDVEYGLQAGIFTADLEKAFFAAAHLDCGGVMINDSTDYRIDAMPFGGVKGSGLGREGICFALQEMTEPKVVCFNLGKMSVPN